jgi:hypothetical protein
VRTPLEQKIIKITFGWGPNHIWLHTTLEVLWPHYMILEVCWDSLWTLSFGLSQFHGHRSWVVCEVALTSLGIKLSISYISWPNKHFNWILVTLQRISPWTRLCQKRPGYLIFGVHVGSTWHLTQTHELHGCGYNFKNPKYWAIQYFTSKCS